MATVTLTLSNFESTIAESPVLLVDFWAPWCPPCRRFGPIFDAASDKHPDIVFGKVDTQAEQELGATLDVQAIPTLMAFKDGALLFRSVGALPARQLEDLISRVQALEPKPEAA